MSNYPDGTGPNDPKAPWNQKELPEFEETSVGDCEGCDQKFVPLNDDWICEKCFVVSMDLDEEEQWEEE